MNLKLNPFVAARFRFGKNEQQAIFDQRCQGASLICRTSLGPFQKIVVYSYVGPHASTLNIINTSLCQAPDME